MAAEDVETYTEALEQYDPSDIVLVDSSKELICYRRRQSKKLHDSLGHFIFPTQTTFGFLKSIIPRLNGGQFANETIRTIHEYQQSHGIDERIFEVIHSIRVATFVVEIQDNNITIKHALTTKSDLYIPSVSLSRTNEMLITFLFQKIYNDFASFSKNSIYSVHVDFYYSRKGRDGAFHQDLIPVGPNNQYVSLEYFFDSGIICGPELLESSTNFNGVVAGETLQEEDPRLMASARLPICNGDIILFNDASVLHASPQTGTTDGRPGRARSSSQISHDTKTKRQFIRCHMENLDQHYEFSGLTFGPTPMTTIGPARVICISPTTTVLHLKKTGHPFVGGGNTFALMFTETMFKECTKKQAIQFEKNIKLRISIKSNVKGGKRRKTKRNKRGGTKRARESDPEPEAPYLKTLYTHILETPLDLVERSYWFKNNDVDIFLIGESHGEKHGRCTGILDMFMSLITNLRKNKREARRPFPLVNIMLEANVREFEKENSSPFQLRMATQFLTREADIFRVHWFEANEPKTTRAYRSCTINEDCSSTELPNWITFLQSTGFKYSNIEEKKDKLEPVIHIPPQYEPILDIGALRWNNIINYHCLIQKQLCKIKKITDNYVDPTNIFNFQYILDKFERKTALLCQDYNTRLENRERPGRHPLSILMRRTIDFYCIARIISQQMKCVVIYGGYNHISFMIEMLTDMGYTLMKESPHDCAKRQSVESKVLPSQFEIPK